MAERKGGDLNEQIAEIAECPICADRIQNNRLLPCGHTFCLKCLEQYKRAAKISGKSLPCPVCRKEFTIPKGGCSMFPKNIIVEKLLEVDAPSKDESNSTLCDTCEKENQTNAVVHCIECGQSLCGECEKLHGRLRASATHHVVPVSKTSHFRDFAKRSYCDDHPEYALELMCDECNRTICWKCRSLSHAQHRATDMKDLADGYCEQLQSNIEEINQRLSILSKISENIKDQEKQFQDNFEKEKTNVSKTAADLIRSVVSNEDKLIRQLSSVLQRNLKSLQPHGQQVQTQMDSLRQYMASVNQLKESGNCLEIVNRTTELHDTATQLLSSNIISLNEPILSSMTESEIQKHLIGSSNVAAANGSADVSRVSSGGGDRRHGGDSDTNSAEVHLTSSDQVKMTSSQTKASPLNLTASSETRPNPGSRFKCNTLPRPMTAKKPQQPTRPQSLFSPSQDYMNVAAASESQAPAEDSDSDAYVNLPTSPAVPRPQPPSRPSLVSTQSSASEGDIQKAKAPEQQQSAKKDVLIPTSNVPLVASFAVADGSAVLGVAVNRQKLYVAAENRPEISVYSCDDHSLLHALVVPGLKQVNDLSFCQSNNCLYLIDWMMFSIFRVEVEGAKEITHWNTNGEFGGLSVSGDASVVLAGHDTSSLMEYTTNGNLRRKIILKSDISEGIRPWHALKLMSGKFVVSHGSSSNTALHQVCIVDGDGQVLKSFGGLRGRGRGSLWGPYHLCMTVEENRLFAADCNNGRIVILNENLEFMGEIAGKLRKPRRICLDKISKTLYVTDNTMIAKKASDGRIVVFSQVL